MMTYKYTNLLVNETSPYLLQHAHNPVNWYAWGEEALNRAKAEDKIILVSIGYSACHWCHVMERESFENEATAALMNDYFINIKIDREERPDIDHIYMDAVQAMTGSGGWPLNVFLTPDAKPFYGGTYFPPERAFNRSSWKEILKGVYNAWQERKEEIISQAQHLTDHIEKSGNFVIGEKLQNEFSARNCKTIFSNIMQSADREWGGFGKAPKFPQTFIIQYLLEYYHFTKDQEALDQALLSIDKMLHGGIYDHIAGGLARYSTDAEWLAPHFEKMLYDNALFILVLCDAFQITGNKIYEAAIQKTISFILTELTDDTGGFYAALDADSEGEEGKYYVWSKDEIDDLLGEDATLFCEVFDVTAEGNWDGKNILRLLAPISEFAKQQGIDESKLTNLLNKCLEKLHIQQLKRTRPGLDDKIILGWNALMLKAICKAAIVLNNESYKSAAIKNAAFLLSSFLKEAASPGLLHTFKNGWAKYPAFLDDYAYLIEACIGCYELTFREEYLNKAYQYTEYVCNMFSDNEQLFFFYTAEDQEDVIVRKKEIYDGAMPSANAVMAANLFKMSVIYDNMEWLQRADKMLQAIHPTIVKYPSSFGLWATIMQQQIMGVNEIAITGKGASVSANKIIRNNFIPNKIILASDTINNNIPFFTDKKHGEVLNIYLCKNRVCLPPLKNEEELITSISSNKF